MKKNILAILSLSILFFLLFVPIDLASANPADLFHYPWESPITSPPQIIIHSPVENQSCKSPNLFLNFSVIKPNIWYFGGVRTAGVEVFGKITHVYCQLDNGQPYTFTVNDWDSPRSPCNKTSLDFSANIPFDSAGPHNIKVFVQGYTQYVEYTAKFGFRVLPFYVNSTSETLNFTTFQKHPTIIFVNPLRINYNESIVPVEFFIDEPVEQMQYCLDGQDKMVVSGNFTLSGLSNGNHSLTIYVKDYSETIVASKTSYFSVDVPIPFIVLLLVAASIPIVVVSTLLVFHLRKINRQSRQP